MGLGRGGDRKPLGALSRESQSSPETNLFTLMSTTNICVRCAHHKINPKAGNVLCAAPQLNLADSDDPTVGFVAGVSARQQREAWTAEEDAESIRMQFMNGICGRAGSWYQPIFKEDALQPPWQGTPPDSEGLWWLYGEEEFGMMVGNYTGAYPADIKLHVVDVMRIDGDGGKLIGVTGGRMIELSPFDKENRKVGYVGMWTKVELPTLPV